MTTSITSSYGMNTMNSIKGMNGMNGLNGMNGMNGMKGLHVIEVVTNDQPYPAADKLIEKLNEFQSFLQEEVDDLSIGSSKQQQQIPSYLDHIVNGINGIDEIFTIDGSEGENHLLEEYGEEEEFEFEALMKKNEMIKSAIEKIRKATEEQEKQLRDKEEELQELYETIAELEELEEELDDEDIYIVQSQADNKAKRLGCFFIIMMLPILLVLLLNAYIETKIMPLIN
ncbi:hypothetical protein Glove_364g59 [Diversispora epigaea]|uniref:Uncharacterized protein n=1 Tax=Diversispora epigaea TaxID=1348612 RepID=A0A397H8J6_9GLOM|nr:hypothetical protein Glove_364g59 [Diversispora epigaea]